jgi:hypothetical protein
MDQQAVQLDQGTSDLREVTITDDLDEPAVQNGRYARISNSAYPVGVALVVILGIYFVVFTSIYFSTHVKCDRVSTSPIYECGTNQTKVDLDGVLLCQRVDGMLYIGKWAVLSPIAILAIVTLVIGVGIPCFKKIQNRI